ncbi:MAG TPA: hypothetical protein PKO30_00345 [Prolixibacteraceae bacterium]|nr:hypothetical protein [Prolixibacteraceae bacterium]
MKRLVGVLLVVFFSLSLQGYAQCKVQSSKGANGVAFKYLSAEFVGAGTGCELGVSYSSNGPNFFFNTHVKYAKKPVKSEGTLMVALKNNQSLALKMSSSQINAQTVMSVYALTASDLDKLEKTAIDKIVFQEAGGKNQSVTLIKNNDVAQRQIKCLKEPEKK